MEYPGNKIINQVGVVSSFMVRHSQAKRMEPCTTALESVEVIIADKDLSKIELPLRMQDWCQEIWKLHDQW